MIRPFTALKDGNKDPELRQTNPQVFAVKQVGIKAPGPGLISGLTYVDLPGINAPSPKAKEVAYDAIKNSLDLVLFVTNAETPSLSDVQIEALDIIRASDASTSVNDRSFCVVNKADIDRRDEVTRLYPWQLALKELKKLGFSEKRIFPTSATWELEESAAARANPELLEQIQKFYGRESSATGITQLSEAINNYLTSEIPRVEKQSVANFQKKFSELMDQISLEVQPIIRAHESDSAELKSSGMATLLWTEYKEGQSPVGLLPKMKEAYYDYTLGENLKNQAMKFAKSAQLVLREQHKEIDAFIESAKSIRDARIQGGTRSANADFPIVDFELRKIVAGKLNLALKHVQLSVDDGLKFSLNEMLNEMTQAEYKGGKLAHLFSINDGRVNVKDELENIGVQAQPIVAKIREAEERIKTVDSIPSFTGDICRDFLLATTFKDRKASLERINGGPLGASLVDLEAKEKMDSVKKDELEKIAEVARRKDEAKKKAEAEKKVEAEKKAEAIRKEKDKRDLEAAKKEKSKRRFFKFLRPSAKQKSRETSPLPVIPEVIQAPVAKAEKTAPANPPAAAPSMVATNTMEIPDRRLPENAEEIRKGLHRDVNTIFELISKKMSFNALLSYHDFILRAGSDAFLSEDNAQQLQLITLGHASQVWPDELGKVRINSVLAAQHLEDLKKIAYQVNESSRTEGQGQASAFTGQRV